MIENTIPEKWSTKLKSGGKNVILGRKVQREKGMAHFKGWWCQMKFSGKPNLEKEVQDESKEWTKDYKEGPWDALTMYI